MADDIKTETVPEASKKDSLAKGDDTKSEDKDTISNTTDNSKIPDTTVILSPRPSILDESKPNSTDSIYSIHHNKSRLSRNNTNFKFKSTVARNPLTGEGFCDEKEEVKKITVSENVLSPKPSPRPSISDESEPSPFSIFSINRNLNARLTRNSENVKSAVTRNPLTGEGCEQYEHIHDRVKTPR